MTLPPSSHAGGKGGGTSLEVLGRGPTCSGISLDPLAQACVSMALEQGLSFLCRYSLRNGGIPGMEVTESELKPRYPWLWEAGE